MAALVGVAALCGALALALAGCAGGSAGGATGAGGLGGTDAGDSGASASGPISVYSREDGSGTRGAFIELTGVEEKNADGKKVDNTTEAAAIQSSTNGVMTAVANDETAIGYISLGSLNDSVKAVKVDGIEASAETVKDGSYVIQRPFVLVTKTGAKLSENAQKFFDFALSAEAAQYITSAGAVPVNG